MMENQTGSQTVLVVAMGLVTTASAVALYRHVGLAGPVATTAALAAFLLLVTGHMLAWRRERRALGPTPADRREQGLHRLKDDARATPREAQMSREAQRDFGPREGQQPPAQRGPRPAMPPASGLSPGQAPRGQGAPQRPAAKAERAAPPPPLPSTPPAPRTQAPVESDDDLDFWSFRPAPDAAPTGPQAANAQPKGNERATELPPFVTGRVPAPGQAVEPKLPEPAPQRAASPKEADVEVIQDAIKRLLEEVNAAEHEARAPAAASRTASESNVEQAIDALRMTAGTMRAASPSLATPPAMPASAGRSGHEAAPQPPPLPPFVRGQMPGARPFSAADAQARLMADAISAGRIDVTLEPILGLEDQQTRHYEVCVRLRDSDGNVLDVTPDGPDLRGTGLLPLFDGVRVTRTAAIARRLEERGKGGSVFSAFSGESVADEHFLGELAETLHQRSSLATQLVLSFTQSDVRGFSTPEWDSLADMRALGFRFAMSHITDLDMDFEALAEQGFAFVKLDASVFLEGLPAPSGHLPSSDVCRHLAQHGLTLVVEHIDDEEKLARVFGFGVLLGQGQLFGGPRPVRADVIRGRGATAAA